MVLALYLSAIGLSDERIGLLLYITLIGDAGISLIVTLYADTVGRRLMLLLGCLLKLLGGLVLASVYGPVFWLLALGCTFGVISPSGNEVGPFLALEQSMLVDQVKPTERTITFAWYNFLGSCTSASGALFAGFFTTWLTEECGFTLLDSYRVIFAQYGGISVLLIMVVQALSQSVEAPGATGTSNQQASRVGAGWGLGQGRQPSIGQASQEEMQEMSTPLLSGTPQQSSDEQGMKVAIGSKALQQQQLQTLVPLLQEARVRPVPMLSQDHEGSLVSPLSRSERADLPDSDGTEAMAVIVGESSEARKGIDETLQGEQSQNAERTELIAEPHPLETVLQKKGDEFLVLQMANLEASGSAEGTSEPTSTAAMQPKKVLGISRKSRTTVLHLCILFAMDSFASGMVTGTLLAYYFHNTWGVSNTRLGGILFGAIMIGGLSSLASGWVADRFGLINTMVFTHLPSSIFLILVPTMPTAQLATLMVFLRYSISQMDVVPRQSYVSGVVSAHDRTATIGVTNIVRSLGAACGPLVTGWLASKNLFGWAFVLSGCIQIAYDLALLWSFRQLKAEHERQH